MKKRMQRIIIRRVIYVILVLILFFALYGIRAFVYNVRHRIAHSKEVTITSEELEKIVEQNEQHFVTQDPELIEKLEKEYYSRCSEEEQLEILAHIGSLEAQYLGIAVPEFKLVYLRNDLGGYYDQDTNQIVLNLQHISHEKCSIRTVIHEMFHAYQYACIREINSDSNLLWAREIATWKEENLQLNNDFDSNEGMVRYYTAMSEESARDYAEKRTKNYFVFIENENQG